MSRFASKAIAGPLILCRRAPVKAGLLVFLVILLTALTQIGGVALWFCVPASVWATRRVGLEGSRLKWIMGVGIFASAYLGLSMAAIPLASLSGRLPLDCDLLTEASPAPRSILTCLFNRHYVEMPVRQALQNINRDFRREFKDAEILYLDAGFPFFDWFPMLPQLSHGDGRKVDLALLFNHRTATPSPIGYWGFVQPRADDPEPCRGRSGFLRWDMKWLQALLPQAPLDDRRTGWLLRRLVAEREVRQIFVEPHIRARLDVAHPKIGFQGCWAARHDDHLHIEFR